MSDEELLELKNRVLSLEISQKEMHTQLDVNTGITASVKKDTLELLSLFEAAKGFVKIASILGGLVKWGSSVAVGVGILWGVFIAFKSGTPPPPTH